MSRDGQEVEPTIGEQLIRLWDHIPSFPVRSPKFAGHQGPPHFQSSPQGHHHGPPGHPQFQAYGGFGDDGFRGGPRGGYGGGGVQYGGPPHQQMYPGGYGGSGGPGGQGQNPVMILQRGQAHPQARSGGAQYYSAGKEAGK